MLFYGNLGFSLPSGGQGGALYWGGAWNLDLHHRPLIWC
ncbi:MAG: hypothetical protein RL757_1201 [Bacteroidota bacterium]|jgi:hypothetical protein